MPSFELEAHSHTNPGKKRSNNEDSAAYFQPDNLRDLEGSGSLYIVADGVGGEALGERASQYAVQKLLYEYYQHPELPPVDRLRQAIRQASTDIFNYASSAAHVNRMATTLVAAVVLNDKLIVANVGDSRAYLIRGAEVIQVSHDHNLVGELVRNGSLTEEEALSAKVRNRLTRSVGGEPDTTVDFFERTLLPGDKILLCSDGLTRYALRSDISTLTREGSPEVIANRLVDFANQHGGADNISVVVVAVGKLITTPTMRLRQGQTPVESDILKTSPGDQATRRLQRKSIFDLSYLLEEIPPNLRKYLIGAFLFMVIVLLALCVTLVVLLNQMTTGSKGTPTGSTSDPKLTQTVTVNITSTPNLKQGEPGAGDEIIHQETVTPTVTVTLTPSPTASITPTSASSSQLDLSLQPACRYPIQTQDDGPYNILEKLGAVDPNNLVTYVKCALSSPSCTYDKDPTSLKNGDYLILYFTPDCEKLSGYGVTVVDCQYSVLENEQVKDILKKMKIPNFSDSKTIQEYTNSISCVVNQDADCTQDKINDLQPKWQIMIPQVRPKDCTNAKGTPVQ
jgi:serine/threonine protein phosphatase PrpC